MEAQLIEVIRTFSYPVGEIGMNSFDETPKIIDEGLMNRGIAAIGKQDVIIDNLTPLDNDIKIIGGSSDHLLLNLRKTNYQIGDIIRFKVNYPGLLHLMNSRYVTKTVV
jgi:predicted amino acid racemase